MAKSFPDAVAEGKRFGELIAGHETHHPEVGLGRVLTDSPMLEKKAVRAGVLKFHRERMSATPDPVKYPESKPWVEYARVFEKEFQRVTGFDDTQVAISQSLNEYLCFRGYRECANSKKKPGKGAGLVTPEKCRVVFDPDTDRGPMHAKNIDDPITHYKKTSLKPTFIARGQRRPLILDGTGAGLHMDHEPKEELFPLPVMRMCSFYNDETPGALEFIQRYGKFWSGANVVVIDADKRSVAVEKCARNFMEIHHPDYTGRSHCSGMAVRNRNSPLARHREAMRAEYLAIFGLHNNPKDTPDVAFWNSGDDSEELLGWFVKKPTQITVQEYAQLLTRARPHGLRSTGTLVHPRQATGTFTLHTQLQLWDERVFIRYQADELKGGAYPAKPEVFRG